MKKLLLCLIFLLSFRVVEASGCDALLTREAAEFIADIVTIARIAVPILLIVLCSSDFVAIVTGQDEKVTKTSISRIIKRFIAASAFFFVPLIIQLILGIDAVNNALNLVDDPSCGIDGDLDGYKSEEEIQKETEERLEEERKKKEEEEKKKKEEEEKKKQEEEEKKQQGQYQDQNPSGNDGISDENRSDSYIESITSSGVLVTIKAKAVDGIKAYYFTYNNSKFPNKTAGYLETSNTTIQVGRLPGTTYVWIEDKNGKISEYKKITISNDVVLNTKSPITKGKSLKKVFIEHGTTYQEFDKLIARSARAAGAYTKEGAATVAVTTISVLDKQYGVRIPYRGGGKYNHIGINYTYGNPTGQSDYPYYGFDCDGYTHWSYINAGVKINTSREHNYWYWDKIPFSKEEVEIGDIIAQTKPNAHVKIVVGFTDTGIIVAHANGKTNGVWINEHKYSDTKYDYTLIKGSKIQSYYDKNKDLPSGF